jgi:hypothetical protein
MLLAVPGKLRPGQMSIVMLGRVIIGDIAVTLVDLAERGRVELTEVPQTQAHPGDSEDGVAANADWTIHVPSRPTAAAQTASTIRPHSIVPFEQTLLDGLSGYAEPTPLNVVVGGFGYVLDKVRAELIHEAVHQGWLRRWHHDQRTPEGDALARKLRAFHSELRQLKAEHGDDPLIKDWLSFAVHFGLVSPERVALARFARAWNDAFSNMKGWSQRDDPWRREQDDTVDIDNRSAAWRYQSW